MKLDIPKTAGVQTAFRLPEEHWIAIQKLAKENKCSNSDIIRYIIAKFLTPNQLTKKRRR